jgi:hypothetical protein
MLVVPPAELHLLIGHVNYLCKSLAAKMQENGQHGLVEAWLREMNVFQKGFHGGEMNGV